MATPKTAPSEAETAMEGAAQAFASLAERSRTIYESSLRTWNDETRTFMEVMARDGARAFEDLQACKSPMEAIAVEQAWLMARSLAYMDAGRRVIEAAMSTASAASSEAEGSRPAE